jgi:hypothetical protein
MLSIPIRSSVVCPSETAVTPTAATKFRVAQRVSLGIEHA